MGPCPRVAATSRLQYAEALSCRQHCWARTAAAADEGPPTTPQPTPSMTIPRSVFLDG